MYRVICLTGMIALCAQTAVAGTLDTGEARMEPEVIYDQSAQTGQGWQVLVPLFALVVFLAALTSAAKSSTSGTGVAPPTPGPTI